MRRNRMTINSLKLVLFALYNAAYVLYMTGFIGRIVNLLILALFILLCALQYCFSGKKEKRARPLFLREFRHSLFVVFSFLMISVVIQLSHEDLRLYLLSELLYNIIPPVLAFFWINSTDKKDLKKYFYIFFARAVAYFLIKNGAHLSLENIRAINWGNSFSSIFETTLAHDFLVLEIIFFYLGSTKLAVLSTILCLLSFKRISFILSLLVLIGFFVTRIVKKKNINGILNKGVCSRVKTVTACVVCIAPLLLNWAVSDPGVAYLRSKNIDINDFSTGRVFIIRHVNKNIEYYNGYGSSDHYLETSNNELLSKIGNMHCDFLKLYYETTMLGVIIFTYCMTQIFSKKKVVFGIYLYALMEMLSSHFLDVLSVWNMLFMFAAYVYAYEKSGMEQGDEKHNKTKAVA